MISFYFVLNMMSIILFTIILFSLGCSPTVGNVYFEEFPLEKFDLTANKRNVKSWLQEFVQKPHDTNEEFKENSYNLLTETNCKEVSIDLHIGGSVNHHPGIVEHRYCFNIKNSNEDTCLHRLLKCKQHLEPIYIQDKDNCDTQPFQHYRPAGCKCSLNF